MRSVRHSVFAGVILLASCDPTGATHPAGLRIAHLSANDRVAAIGEQLTLSLRVIDDHGKWVPGVTVRWDVGLGGGMVSPAISTTSQDGVASTQLSPGLGENAITARVEGSDLTASFSAYGCARCGTWSLVPVDLGGDARAWASAASVDGRIWVIGGEGGQDDVDPVFVLDPKAISWRRGISLSSRATGAVAASAQGRLYVIGGIDPQVFPSPSAVVVAADPTLGDWTGVARLQIGRAWAAGAALDGKVYVVGGFPQCDPLDGCWGVLATVEIYDPATNRLTTGTPMLWPRAFANAAALDGKLYIAGGVDEGFYWNDVGLVDVQVFDPATNRWTRIADLPVRARIQLAALNGTLYAIASLRERAVTRTYAYDPSRNLWTRLRDAPVLLYGAAVGVVDSGIYAIGGYSVATDRPWVRNLSRSVYVLRP